MNRNIRLLRYILKNTKRKIIRQYRLLLSRYWYYYSRISLYLKQVYHQYSYHMYFVVLIFLGTCFALFLANPISLYVSNLNIFENILISTGCALIGLSILSFSLIMVAMQVSVDKLPNELFRRFNNDFRLKLLFILMFFTSFCITCLSLFLNVCKISFIVSLFIFLILLMLYLIFLTYERSHSLLNPLLQIKILLNDLRKDTKQFEKNYRKIEPLIKLQKPSLNIELDDKTDFDSVRFSYIQFNSSIIHKYTQYIEYLISISNIYAKMKDYKISLEALRGIINIHQLYISIKGKTFFNDVLLFDNPLSVDNFINSTLEKLRIELNVNFSNKDEIQLENILNTIALLANSYLNIQYVNNILHKNKHCLLACFYLINGIKKALDYGLQDVTIKALEYCKSIFVNIAIQLNPNESMEYIQPFGELIYNIFNKNNEPCASNFLSVLSETQKACIISDKSIQDVLFDDIIKTTYSVALQTLYLTNDPFNLKQESILSQYFSLSNNSFLSFLIKLTDKIFKSPETEENKKTLRNIYDWLISSAHEANILRDFIKNKSLFSRLMIDWNIYLAGCCIQLSTLPIFSSNFDNKLEEVSHLFIHHIVSLMKQKEFLNSLHTYKAHEGLLRLAAYTKNIGVFNNYEDTLVSCFINALQISCIETSYKRIFTDCFEVLIAIVAIGDCRKLSELIDFCHKNKDKMSGLNIIFQNIMYAVKNKENQTQYTHLVLASLNETTVFSIITQVMQALK